MSPFWLLTRVRLSELVRVRGAAFFLLALPLALLTVVTLVFANGHPFERPRVALCAASSLPLRASEVGLQAQLRLLPCADRDTGQRWLSARMTELVYNGPDNTLECSPQQELFARGLAASLQTQPEVHVRALPRWGFVHYLFPGIVTYVVLLSGLFGMGYLLVQYRQNGLLKKLATTPLPRWNFIAAQATARTVITSLQLALLLVAAHLTVGLPLRAVSLAWLVVLVPLGLFAFLGMGYLLACWIDREGAMMDAITVVSLPLVFLSEIFFPVTGLPQPLPLVASCLPSTWLVRLLRHCFFDSEVSLNTMLPGISVLVCWTLVGFGLGNRWFRWQLSDRR